MEVESDRACRREASRVSGLPEFLDEVDSEASDAESPPLRMLLVVELLKKLLVEQAKLRLRKEKRKKTLTCTSSESRRILSKRSLLVRNLLRKSLLVESLSRSKW